MNGLAWLQYLLLIIFTIQNFIQKKKTNRDALSITLINIHETESRINNLGDVNQTTTQYHSLDRLWQYLMKLAESPDNSEIAVNQSLNPDPRIYSQSYSDDETAHSLSVEIANDWIKILDKPSQKHIYRNSWYNLSVNQVNQEPNKIIIAKLISL